MNKTFNLISIQHELAMSIGKDIRLKPMLHTFLKVCVHRLSLRSCHVYSYKNPSNSSTIYNEKLHYYTSFPITQKKLPHDSPILKDYLIVDYKNQENKNESKHLHHENSNYHIFPIGNFGLLVLERANQALDNDIIAALTPIFERLNASCNAASEHENTLSEISKRKKLESALWKQLKLSKATTKIAELVATEENANTFLNGVSEILGKTLSIDYVSIYNVNFSTNTALRTNEWRHPTTDGMPPDPIQFSISSFISTTKMLHEKKNTFTLESHADSPHQTLVNDSSDIFLHTELKIKSLLWKTLLYKNNQFYFLSLKQKTNKRVWQPEEHTFINSVAYHVSIALKKFDLLRDKICDEENLRLAATAFETNEAIFITDKNAKIQRVNKAFSHITGYSAHEAIGKTPSLLQSGRQDKTYFKNMWQSLLTTGQWKGELWNKRKNGETYAQWQSISAVYDQDKKITHYIAMFQDISERKQADARIRQMAYYDNLTALANRTLLLEQLDRELSFGSRHRIYGAILFLDLDRFKNINDSLGHSAGDALLREVAARLKNITRNEDTVSRLGGDEFVILLPQLGKDTSTATQDAEQIAEKIRAILSEPYILSGHNYHVTPSIGIALFPENEPCTTDDILKHADSAMYRAKAAGRNTIQFYHPAMQAAVDERLRIEKDLRIAIKRQDLLLHYQPQLNQEGALIGVEALLRWQHPLKGVISPNEFISIAEDTGQILCIGEWVLETASVQIKKWIDLGLFPPNATLSVNVSPKQFHQDNFIDIVKNILTNVAIDPSIIKLEITESLVMGEIEDTIEKMHSLKRYGVDFSVDDFGTGYSSLAYLKTLPLSQLKIDKSFVQDITHDPNDATIVETIIIMAEALGLDVIAEGVETQAELKFLAEKGCTKYQGHYFSPALGADELVQFIQKNDKSLTYS